jgi:hypothetical protein
MLPMTKAAAWTIAVGLAIAAIASLWLAGEMHYRNCLAQEEAEVAALDIDYGAVFGAENAPGAGCSRLPF